MVGGSSKKFWFKGVPNDVPFYLLEKIEFFDLQLLVELFNNTRFLRFKAEC